MFFSFFFCKVSKLAAFRFLYQLFLNFVFFFSLFFSINVGWI